MDSSQAADQSFEPSSEYMPLVRRTRSWELDRANINVIKIIGKGAFSRVGKAAAAGIPGTRGELTVAVKMLKGTVYMNRFLLWATLKKRGIQNGQNVLSQDANSCIPQKDACIYDV